jgi:protein SCO1/2
LTGIKAPPGLLAQDAVMHLRRFVVFLAATGILLVPQLPGAERIFDVTGVVRSPAKEGRIVITHDEITGFMPAMTMGFSVAPSGEAAPLQVGDRVQFRLHVTETSSIATDFKLLGRTSSVAPGNTSSRAAHRLREGDRVPAFALLNQEGAPLTADVFGGHLTIVTFVFTRCPVPEYCPAIALRFGQLQRAIQSNPDLAARVRLLSISIDPEFDRPEILKAYGAAVGADPAIWQFATGEKTEIARISADFAVFTERNGVTLDHTLCTALIDADGRVVELWRGSGWRADEVIAALVRAAAR